MADATEKQPSMEDILSSIRRIIADEGAEHNGLDEQIDDVNVPSGSDAADPSLQETVLELTEDMSPDDEPLVLEEEAETAETVAAEPVAVEPAAQEQPVRRWYETVDVSAPESGPEAETTPEEETLADAGQDMAGDDKEAVELPVERVRSLVEEKVVMGAQENDSILSEDAAGDSRQAFDRLTAVLKAAENPVQDMSLRDVVEQALRPVLKQWLDENLSRIVEDLVQQEINHLRRNRK